MQIEEQALKAALVRFKSLVVALGCADRVIWVDKLIGRADQQDAPAPWGIYEPTMVRDELATLVQALERYNDACIALTA
jgi:hypothetical protein